MHAQLQADQQETQESWTEIRAGYQRFLDDHADLREIREGFRQIAGEFAGIKEDVQRERTDLHELYAKVESQLSRLVDLGGGAAGRPVHDRPATRRLPTSSSMPGSSRPSGCSNAQALEAELEAMRRRAAEQVEALSEQKRLAGQQQAELAGELKRMRSLLEALGSQVRGEPAAAGGSAKAAAGRKLRAGSVLAQFEMLQRDMHLRRNKTKQRSRPRWQGASEFVNRASSPQ